MKYPKILVTGATGRTGSAVVDELLAKGVPVRALVHSKDVPFARKAAARKDRSCHLQLCSESV